MPVRSMFLGENNTVHKTPSGSVLMRDVFLNLRRELLKNPHYQLVPSEVRAPSFFFCVVMVQFTLFFFSISLLVYSFLKIVDTS